MTTGCGGKFVQVIPPRWGIESYMGTSIIANVLARIELRGHRDGAQTDNDNENEGGT